MAGTDCSALTAHEARMLWAYDPLTGLLTRRTDAHGGRWKAGQVVGCINKYGHVVVGFRGRLYYAHRIAYLMVTGAWPVHGVDHIDGDGSNNAWSNIRVATQAQNCQNQHHGRRRNRSGFLGVSQKRNKYEFAIQVNGARQRKGGFSTAEEAHQAYIEAKRRLHPFGTL